MHNVKRAFALEIEMREEERKSDANSRAFVGIRNGDSDPRGVMSSLLLYLEGDALGTHHVAKLNRKIA